MSPENWSSPDEDLSSDASLDGFGAISSNQFFHALFPSFIKENQLHINCLELLAIIIATNIGDHKLKGKKYLFPVIMRHQCTLLIQVLLRIPSCKIVCENYVTLRRFISLRLKLNILLGKKIGLKIIYLDGIYITDIKIVLFPELNFRITKKFKFLILAIIFLNNW
jgi:hypothetical protein